MVSEGRAAKTEEQPICLISQEQLLLRKFNQSSTSIVAPHLSQAQLSHFPTVLIKCTERTHWNLNILEKCFSRRFTGA